jgi:hypothetical protein
MSGRSAVLTFRCGSSSRECTGLVQLETADGKLQSAKREISLRPGQRRSVRLALSAKVRQAVLRDRRCLVAFTPLGSDAPTLRRALRLLAPNAH